MNTRIRFNRPTKASKLYKSMLKEMDKLITTKNVFHKLVILQAWLIDISMKLGKKWSCNNSTMAIITACGTGDDKEIYFETKYGHVVIKDDELGRKLLPRYFRS